MHWLSLLVHADCGFPKWPVAVMVPQNLFMLALFGDFYYKSYVQKTKKDEPDAPITIENDTNYKAYTNGDSSRYRHTNGNSNGNAKNVYTNGNATNGNATNGKTNGNVIRHINEMS